MSNPLRRARRGVAAVSVLLIAAGWPAHAQGPGGHHRLHVRTVAPHFSLASELASERCRAGCGTKDYSYFEVLPLSLISPDGTIDVTGDGGEDFLQITDDGRNPAALVLRRGTDGSKSWATQGSRVLDIFAMRVGVPARPGLVVVTDSTGAAQQRVGGSRRTITAYDGRTGATLWQHKYVASRGGVRAPEGTVEEDGVLLSTDNRPTALLMAYRTGEPGSPGHVVVQPVLVSVAHGGVQLSGAAIKTSTLPPPSTVDVVSLGDEDKDGLADYALATTTSIEARSSASGASLWTTNGSQNLVVLPDVNGDNIADFRVSGVVHDGRTGARRYTLPGAYPFVAGDVDGDGSADLLDPTFASQGTMTMRLCAGSTGHNIWSQSFTAPSSPYSFVGTFPTGDLDGDGIQEFAVYEVDGETSAITWLRVNGRDGTVDPAPVSLAIPLYASIDGAGDDVVTLDQPGGVPTLLVDDGRDGHLLRTLPAAPATDPDFWFGGSVSAPRISAREHVGVESVAMIGAFHGGTTYVRIFDNSGRLLWSASGGYSV